MIRTVTVAFAASSLILFSATVARSENFSERLAPTLGMKQAGGPAHQPKEWKINLLGGLGPVLFGGSAVASFSVRPSDPPIGDEDQRLDRACKAHEKGVLCKLAGPARFIVETKKGEAVTEVLAGERPVVEMRKTTIYCRNE